MISDRLAAQRDSVLEFTQYQSNWVSFNTEDEIRVADKSRWISGVTALNEPKNEENRKKKENQCCQRINAYNMDNLNDRNHGIL